MSFIWTDKRPLITFFKHATFCPTSMGHHVWQALVPHTQRFPPLVKVGGMQVDSVSWHLFKDTQSRLLTSVGTCCLQLIKLGCFSQAKKSAHRQKWISGTQTRMCSHTEEIKEKRSFIYLFLSFSSSAQGPRLITLIKSSFTMWIMFPNNAGALLLTDMMQISFLPLAESTILQFWWVCSRRGNAEHLNLIRRCKMSEKNGHLETSAQTLTLKKQTPPRSAYFWVLFWVSFHML